MISFDMSFPIGGESCNGENYKGESICAETRLGSGTSNARNFRGINDVCYYF